MSKVFSRCLPVLAVLAFSAASAFGGTITSISQSVVSAHDLAAVLTVSNAFSGNPASPGSFNFGGVAGNPLVGSFSLVGNYDTTALTVSGTFSANGVEQIGGGSVSYLGTISKMDLSQFSGGLIRFLIDQPSGPQVVVAVATNNRMADASAVAVPLPAAVYSGGMVLVGLLGGGVWRRRAK